MKGWFDAFRIDGGPTLYSYSNRTPVTGDVPLVIVFVVFGTIFTAFLVIFPGIRKEVNASIFFLLLLKLLSYVIDRCNYELITTFFVSSTAFQHVPHGDLEPFCWSIDSRFIRLRLIAFFFFSLNYIYITYFSTFIVAQYGSSWHTSSATIVSTYSAFSRQKTAAEIGGYIGLMHINITYRCESFITNFSVDYNSLLFVQNQLFKVSFSIIKSIKNDVYKLF